MKKEHHKQRVGEVLVSGWCEGGSCLRARGEPEAGAVADEADVVTGPPGVPVGPQTGGSAQAGALGGAVSVVRAAFQGRH